MPSLTGSAKPNIIWIMADDMSWGDSGCFGQDKIATPNIDSIALNGMLFTSCYSGSTVCAPSRSCLMQGLHQGHASVRENYVAHSGGDYRASLQANDITVAQVLKQAGYACGLFGKWGLSLIDQPGVPTAKGFDAFCGYLNQRHAHSYYPTYLWQNTDKILFPQHEGHNHRKPNEYDENGQIVLNGVRAQRDLQYAFDVYHQASLDWVRRNYQQPFFLYLAHTPPHGMLECPTLEEYAHLDWPSVDHKLWAAMITHMDRAIGELFDLFRELGVYDNSLIFWVSDNGFAAHEYQTNLSFEDFFHNRGPWKGRKGDLNQGGVRVPAVVQWPGHVKPGTKSDQVWAFWDFMATAAEAAGVQPPKTTDGISILPTALGQPQRQQHEYLYWEYNDEQSVRMGDRYIYRPHPARPIEVYDAINDPRQLNNLAAVDLQTLRRAEEIFHEAHTDMPYHPAPGQTHEDWEAQLRQRGIVLPNNVDG